MHSLPGETLKDVQITRDLMRELKFYGPNIRVAPAFTFIYPGTEMETIAKREGSLMQDFNWSVPVEFVFNRKIGVNPSIPIYNQKGLKAEEISDFIDSPKTRYLELIKSVFPAIKGIKSFGDFKHLFKRIIKLIRNLF